MPVRQADVLAAIASGFSFLGKAPLSSDGVSAPARREQERSEDHDDSRAGRCPSKRQSGAAAAGSGIPGFSGFLRIKHGECRRIRVGQHPLVYLATIRTSVHRRGRIRHVFAQSEKVTRFVREHVLQVVDVSSARRLHVSYAR
jgi:hypothetical protein